MQKVYFISGLGADKRAFSLLDLSFCEPVFVEWITPLKNESMEDYAHRLRKQIPEKNPIIVGLSFGGMLATEMAKADPEAKVIILSSSKTVKELPGYFRAGKYIPIYKLFPSALLKRSMLASQWLFGLKEKRQRQLFRQIVASTDTSFTKWAIYAILYWKNKTVPTNLIHVHGDADRLIPVRYVNADHIVKGGTHVMPMDNYREVSELLQGLIIEERPGVGKTESP